MQLAAEQAKEMVKMLEDGSITRFVADQFGLSWVVVPAAGRSEREIDLEINRKAFSLPRPADGNKSVGYVELSNGDAAVISVTNVVNKAPAEVDLANIDSLARVLAAREGSSDYLSLQSYLETEARVSKN